MCCFFGKCYKIKLITIQIRKSLHVSHISGLQVWQRCIGLQKEGCEIDLMFSSSLLACLVRSSPPPEIFLDVKIIKQVLISRAGVLR